MYKFVNAQEMSKKYPETFEAPLKAELDSLKKGKIVKVCYNDERFWVVISKVGKKVISGTVNNGLICNQPFNYGDEIEFKKQHIYSICQLPTAKARGLV